MKTPVMSPIHATTVARRTAGRGWCGVLIQGPSGSGKSDLALRLIGSGWRLVADDYTHLWASGGGLYATSPTPIAGRIEARGLGIVTAPVLKTARVVLAIQCVAGAVERLPDDAVVAFAGLSIPVLALDTRHASAVDLVAAAMVRL